MQWKVLMIVLTGLSALFVTGCSTNRMATNKSVEARIESSEKVQKVDSVMVAVHDTIMETTTITIRENEAGDTIKVVRITDRERVRNSDRIEAVKNKIEARIDTVYVECRDSVYVKNTNLTNDTNKRTSLLSYLKWIFWIVIAVTVMIVVIKLVKVFRV